MSDLKSKKEGKSLLKKQLFMLVFLSLAIIFFVSLIQAPFVKVTNAYNVTDMDGAEDDVTLQDVTTCLTDGDTSTSCILIDAVGGPDNDMVLKVNRSVDPSTLTNLELRLFIPSESGGNEISIYAYDSSISVNESDIIIASITNGGGTDTFNLTQFLTNGSFQSSSTYAIRVTANGNNAFDLAEVEVQETSGADTEAPQWFDNSSNSTVAGANVLHSVRWTDAVLSGYIFSFDNGTGTLINDSFVEFTGTSNHSNVTKFINNTIGTTIQWRVYANDTTNNFNVTDIFSYDTIAEVTDSCSCPSVNTNWEINMSDSCTIYTDCNIGTGNITFVDIGNATFNATITARDMGQPPSSSTLFIGPQCMVNLG